MPPDASRKPLGFVQAWENRQPGGAAAARLAITCSTSALQLGGITRHSLAGERAAQPHLLPITSVRLWTNTDG